MMRAVQRAPEPIIYPGVEPGVHRLVSMELGGVFYLAIGQGGVLLDIRKVRPDETEAQVAVASRRIWQADRPALTLHSPSSSPDAAPSPSRPAPRLGLVRPRSAS
jgi:hypothetical protein